MRTTVELPPALLRAAKARSAERGESLKTLFTRAVAAELGGHASGPDDRRRRMSLPLFGSTRGEPVSPSNADLERALADEDAGHPAETRPRRPRRRATR